MSHARDLIYVFVNRLGSKAAKEGLPRNQHMIEAASLDDDYLSGLLNWVEDDRAHKEAVGLRRRADELADKANNIASESMVDAYRLAANEMDPYKERDGRLFRKSDDKPVIL